MPKIDKIAWGNVWVDGKKYHQVIIVADQIWERDREKLENFFGTTHEIGDWEVKELFSHGSTVILIANGWNGFLKVKSEIKNQAAKKGIELKIVPSDQITQEYNQLVSEGKKVNALVHTTC